MSWFSKVFSNPVKTLADVGSFGATFALRESRIAPKLANNITRVYATTSAGILSGFATGGIPGAFTGGAAGFGRGVSAATHGEDIDLNLLGAGAKWGAIAGGVTGAVKGAGPSLTYDSTTGAARATTFAEKFTAGGAGGIVRDALVSGASKLSLPSLSSVGKAAGEFALLRSILPTNLGLPSLPAGASGGSFDTYEIPTAGIYGPSDAPPQYTPAPTGTLVTVTPSATPSAAPTAILPTESENAWWLWILAAAAVLFILYRKKILR